mgnify:CR=1 FL=1
MKRFLTLALAALLGVAGLATPALAQNFSSVAVLNGSCSAPSVTFFNDTDTGFYLSSAGVIGVCINGAQVATINSAGLASTVTTGTRVTISQVDGRVEANTASYGGTASQQAIAGDLNLAEGAGTSTAASSAYFAGVMGNTLRVGNLTDTQNLVAGVIGKLDVTGTIAGSAAKAGVIGEVSGARAGQVSSAADGPFVAVLGGDEGPVQARAAYTVDFNNTGNHAVGSSYFRFGVDLQGPGAHDGYMTGRYQDGYIRMGGIYLNAGTLETTSNVCILAGTSAPTNGTSGTGAGQCGAGSTYHRQSGSTSNLYVNTNTTASPTWTAAF